MSVQTTAPSSLVVGKGNHFVRRLLPETDYHYFYNSVPCQHLIEESENDMSSSPEISRTTEGNVQV